MKNTEEIRKILKEWLQSKDAIVFTDDIAINEVSDEIAALLESPAIPSVGREELLADLKQYVANALYYAFTFEKENKLVDNMEFDVWVEEQTDNIDQYLANRTCKNASYWVF